MIADANLLKDRKYIFYRFSSGKRTNSISNYQIEEIKGWQDRQSVQEVLPAKEQPPEL